VVLAREDIPGDKRLVAYVVTQEEGTSADTTERDTATLRTALSQSLPDYMLPSHVVLLDQLPLTPNGKIDRCALPAPDMTRSGAGYVAPRTATEETMASLWAEVLQLDRVGVHDNFFALGGHSLLAMRLISKTREVFQVELAPRLLFEEPTIAAISSIIEALIIQEIEKLSDDEATSD